MNKNIFYLVILKIFMSFSSYLFDIGIVIYLYQGSQSLDVVGGFFIAQLLPAILVLISGELIDYFQSKYLLVWSNILKILLFISLLFIKKIWLIYVITFVYNLLLEFERNMSQVLVAYICEKKQIFKANSVLNVADSFIMIVAPILAAMIAQNYAFENTVLLAALILGVSVIALALLREKNITLPAESKKVMNRSFYLDLFKNKSIVRLAIYWIIFMFCIGLTTPLEIVMIEGVLNKASVFYGIGNMVEGVGMLLAAAFLVKLTHRYLSISIVPIGMFCAALSYFFIGISFNIWIYFIGAFFVGITSALCPMGFRNEIQMACECDTMGRTISSVRFFVVFARLLGTVMISFFIDEMYIRYVYFVVVIILLMAYVSIKKKGLLESIPSES